MQHATSAAESSHHSIQWKGIKYMLTDVNGTGMCIFWTESCPLQKREHRYFSYEVAIKVDIVFYSILQTWRKHFEAHHV